MTIVSVMRLAPRKRPRHLLKMIARVRDQLPVDVRLRVVIIGEGPERASLEKYLRAHDLTDVVELVGRRTRDEIRAEFARADIFVAPANLESFGIAALEARCAGLPVVAKARTGIREFVANGREGLLAQSDRDMVDQLLRLIRDPALRQQIAAHNRAVPPRSTGRGWSRRNVRASTDRRHRRCAARPSRAATRLSRGVDRREPSGRSASGQAVAVGSRRRRWRAPALGTRPARVNTRASA